MRTSLPMDRRTRCWWQIRPNPRPGPAPVDASSELPPDARIAYGSYPVQGRDPSFLAVYGNRYSPSQRRDNFLAGPAVPDGLPESMPLRQWVPSGSRSTVKAKPAILRQFLNVISFPSSPSRSTLLE